MDKDPSDIDSEIDLSRLGGDQKLNRQEQASILGTSDANLYNLRKGKSNWRIEFGMRSELFGGPKLKELCPKAYPLVMQYYQRYANNLWDNNTREVSLKDIILCKSLPPSRDKIKGYEHSLRKHGQLRPIAITTQGELIYGEMRFYAAKAIGWNSVNCIVVDVDAMWHSQVTPPCVDIYLNNIERYKGVKYMQRNFRRFPLRAKAKPMEIPDYLGGEEQKLIENWSFSPQARESHRREKKIAEMWKIGGRRLVVTLDAICRSPNATLLKYLIANEQISICLGGKIIARSASEQKTLLNLHSDSLIRAKLKEWSVNSKKS